MFNTKIPLYGVFITVSITSGLLVVYKNIKKLNLKKEEITGLLIYIGLGAIFGAKSFTFFTNLQKFNGLFILSKVGMSSYGAAIGIIIFLFLFSKQYKKNFKNLVYTVLPSIPLMYGIGKMGCFVSGCCYGIKYNGPLSVTYNFSYSAPKGTSLFPIQLLESIIFIVIFIYIFNKTNKKHPSNVIIGQTFIICGIAKFLLDYLRISHVNKIISINQIVSLVFIVIGLYLVIKNFKIEQND